MRNTNKPRVGEQRPGGQSARVRTAILETTSALLMEFGYDALSIEAIAQRAGVHRTTVYRRWPTKAELVADALGLYADVHIPIPDTGSLANDLRELARAVAANLRSPGGARQSRSIVAAAAASEELSEAAHAFMDRRIALAEPIVERAQARGEMSVGLDPRAVIEPLVGAMWFRLLLTGEEIDDDFVDAVTSLVCSGALR